MASSGSKISFGFSKIKKQSQLVKPVVVEKQEVEYVDSFDGKVGKFSFKGALRSDEVVKKELIIPLTGTKSAYDVIKAKLEIKEETLVKEDPEKTPTISEGDNIDTSTDKSLKDEPSDVKPTLETLAAQELLANLNPENTSVLAQASGLVIAADSSKPNFDGEKESTLDDYEDVPVEQYGLAMLRGMGWTPKTGIGKENKIVAPTTTVPRPKRLGLGADMSSISGSSLPLKRGSFIRVNLGPHKGNFGIVEGVDGDTGDVFVKFDGRNVTTISENVVTTVTKAEYDARSNGKAEELHTKTKEELKYGINEGNKFTTKAQESDSSSEGNNQPSRGRSKPEKVDTTKERSAVSSDSDNRHQRSSSSELGKHRRKKKKRAKSSDSDDSIRGYKDEKRKTSKSKSRKDKRENRRRSEERDSYRKKSSKRDRSRSRSRDRRYKKQKSRRRSRS